MISQFNLSPSSGKISSESEKVKQGNETVAQVQEELIAEIDAKVEGHIRTISALRSRRNLCVPAISRLPEDILTSIFLLLPKEKTYYSRWTWITILQVCKLWRKLAIKTPDLWCYINLSSERKKIMTSLELSRTNGLTIRHGGLFGDMVTGAYEVVLQHLPRIYDLELTSIVLGCDKWQEIHENVDREASLMQRLRLRIENYSGRSIQEITPDSFLDCSKIIDVAPSIKYLDICGLSFNWATCVVKDLVELVLESIPLQCMRPNIAQILGILALSPHLQKLELDKIGPLDSPLESLSTVTLPSLKWFKFLGVVASVCSKTLQFIVLPGDVSWNIQCLDYPISEPMLIYPRLVKAKMGYDHLSVTLEKKQVHIRSGNLARRYEQTVSGLKTVYHDEELVVELGQLQSSDIIQSMTTLCVLISSVYHWKDVHMLEFIVREDRTTATVEMQLWIEFLSLFEQAGTLKLIFDHPRFYSMAETNIAIALKHATLSDNLICPKLKELELTYANFSAEGEFHELLYSALEFRQERGSPIQKLIVNAATALYEEDVEQLKDVVRELIWDQKIISESEGEGESDDDYCYQY